MKIIKKYFDGGEVPRRSTKELALDLAERFRAKRRGAKSERQYGWNEMKQTLQALAPDNNTYNKGWLDGITVTNEGTRPTNRDDWTWAENTQAIQDAAESVRRGIDKNGTPIAAGIYALAAAPFAIEGLGSSAVANGVRTGLQAVDGFFTPSTWLNPVTGTRLLSPTVGAIADSGVLGAFVYDGLNGLYNQYQQGTLLNDPTNTFIHGLEVLPLIGLGSKAVGMGVNAWNGSGMKALWDISRSNAPVDLSEYTKLSPKVRIKVGDVEVNNPQLAYRQGSRNIVNDFLTSGEVRTPEGDYGSRKVGRFDLGKSFENPMFAQGYLWYDLPTKAGDGLLVTAEPLGVGTKGSHLVKDARNGTFDLRYPDVGNSGRRVQLEDGQLSPSNTTAYIWDPNYGYRKVSRTLPKVGFDLLERSPSKISEAERFGLPKVDRNNLSQTQLQALEDLALYRRSGQYRQVFRVTPNWDDFGWNLGRNPAFIRLFAKDRMTMQGPWAKVGLQTPTGRGIIGWFPKRNMAVYTSRSFPAVEGLKYVPGEANMMLDGTLGYKFILTSPRTDILDLMTDLLHSTDPKDIALYNTLNPQLTNTISKDVMKDFWINARKALKPGTYMSGDNGELPLGADLIDAFRKRRLYKTSIYEAPLMQKSISRSGLSPDSYSSIIRLGNRDGSLRWGEGFGTWNDSAVENKYIYEAYLQLMKGEITPDQYADIFNSWAKKIGGRPVEWLIKDGKMYPIHPHPYIFAKKKGGKIGN